MKNNSTIIPFLLAELSYYSHEISYLLFLPGKSTNKSTLYRENFKSDTTFAVDNIDT